MLHETKIQAALVQIIQIANPVRVVLFGSAARSAKKVNDLDFLVVVANSAAPREISRLLQVGVRRSGMPIDFVVVTEDEFARAAVDISSVVNTASQEGKVLYVAKNV